MHASRSATSALVSSMNLKSDPPSQDVISSPCVKTLLVVALLMSFCSLARGKDHSQGAPDKPQLSGLQERMEAGEKAYQRGDFIEAERLQSAAVKEAEKAGDEKSLDLARGQRSLGLVYMIHGRSEESEPLLRRCMAIQMAALASDSPDITDSLNFLFLMGKEKRLGPEHPEVARSLNNLQSFIRNRASMPMGSRSASARLRYEHRFTWLGAGSRRMEDVPKHCGSPKKGE